MKNKDVECDIADLVTYCDENDKDVMYDFEYERITNYIEKIEKELELKDKALDKACEELEEFDCTFNDKDYCDVKNKEEWREWCLKDE